jgi:hypothetical protein
MDIGYISEFMTFCKVAEPNAMSFASKHHHGADGCLAGISLILFRPGFQFFTSTRAHTTFAFASTLDLIFMSMGGAQVHR